MDLAPVSYALTAINVTSLEQKMAEHATAIAAARLECIHYLEQALKKASTHFPRPSLSVRGSAEEFLQQLASRSKHPLYIPFSYMFPHSLVITF